MINNKKTLQQNKEDWEDLAELDIYWFILTNPNKKFGKWNINDFFKTGEKEVDGLIKKISNLGCLSEKETVLDFGCGVGRVSRYLSKHFKKCFGVDISNKMISKAEELNKDIPNCQFILNNKDNLEIFPDNFFNLIYTKLVLQHLPTRVLIKKYILEFIRILKNRGLLVFQVPSRIPFKYRLLINSKLKLYFILKKLKMDKRFIYEGLGLYPLKMNCLSKKDVIELIKNQNAKILLAENDEAAGKLIESTTYYIIK